MYGTLVINEHALPITAIRLRHGKVEVEAHLHLAGRVRLPHGSEFRIHGEDGSLLVTGLFMNHGEDITAGPEDGCLTVIQPLGFVAKAAVGWPD